MEMGEWVREIDSGKLLLKLGSPNPDTASSFPYTTINNLILSNPNSVNSIQAQVTILDNQIAGTSFTRARLEGRWYNDGTPGGGMTGDIWAEVSLRGEPGCLFARWAVAKSLNPEGTSWTDLGGGDFPIPTTIGTNYTLYIEYNSASHQFIFRVGSTERTFGPTGLPARVGDPNSPYKALSTRVQINNPNSSAYISAAFDDVYKNGFLYDNFSSSTIDPTKWTNYEFAREISNGKLRSKVRSSTAYTSHIINLMDITSPMLIKKLQAKITLLDYQNPQGLYQRASVSGAFYNDGTGSPGTGRVGDICAQVRIGGRGSTPIAEWSVWRYTDPAGSETQVLAGGTFDTSITIGRPYTLSIEWDGNQFIMRFENKVDYYTTTHNMSPYVPFKEISTRIVPETDKKEATLEALFDDVKVEYIRNYDDFSGPFIDKGKWTRGEWVREIDKETNKLLMKQASPNPVVATSFPHTESNWLSFSDPNDVNSIQADVAITQSFITNSALTRARLGGRWYNDGSLGGGMTGDIWAEVFLRGDPRPLKARWAVVKFTNPEGTAWTDLGSGDFDTPITLGNTYTLYISYDVDNNRFTFRIGNEEYTFGPADLPSRVGNPNSPFKAIGTRIQINGGASSAFISAVVDNVYKNGSLYDDFSSSAIDPTRWTTYEFAREISDGKLRTKVRSSSAYTSTVSSSLNFISPNLINSISTKVTPLAYQNEQDVMTVARITGRFYNDGTPGGGYIGDVGALVAIGGWEANPRGRWYVYRYTDYDGDLDLLEILAEGEFTTPIILGNTYTLFLGWNGKRFSFRLNNEAAQYVPTTSINPPNNPWKAIGSEIFFNDSGQEATIEASFDDVIINLELLADLEDVNFGDVSVGASRERTITVTNEGVDKLTLNEISNAGGPFNKVGGTCSDGRKLISGESCTIIVKFSPSVVGTFNSNVNIKYLNNRTGDGKRTVANLSGTGVRVVLVPPSQGTIYTVCSYYNLPKFQWDTSEVFKAIEVQFSLDRNFSTVLKAKGNPLLKELQMKTAVWKKVLLLPGINGGTIYWRVVGTKADKTVVVSSSFHSFSIEAPKAAGSPVIAPTNITGIPTLSWENNCAIKFKVWFGSDESFTKKKALAFNIANPNDNGGVFTKQLTSGQWTSIHKLVGSKPGEKIYWYVESWDVVKRYQKTSVDRITLSP